MRLDKVINEFDIITNSIQGLNKLRDIILDLAIKGKLTERIDTDEDANLLLKKIKNVKNKLYEVGKIRKPKRLPELKEQELTDELPEGWVWCRLGDLIHVSSGNNLSKNKRVEGEIPVYGGNGLTGYHNQANVNERSIVIGRVGALCGNVHITPKKVWVTDNAFITYYPKNLLNQEYLVWLLKSLDLQKNVSSTAQPVISGKKIYSLKAPLATPKEQIFIVQKIESLFAQVDELEQKIKEDRTMEDRLQVAALHDIQTARTKKQSQQSWQRILSNFDQIYSTPEHIDNLKQAILNEAVRGRLVEQDPADDPAELLLDRIQEEKQRLYEAEDIRKPKKLPEIKEKEIPYEVPAGWVWCRFGQITINKDAQRIPVSKSDRKSMKGKYPYYGASGIIDYVNDYIFEGKHILIGEDGANLINRSTPIAFIASGRYWVNNHAHVMGTLHPITMYWLEAFINAIDLKPYVTGTAQPKLNQTRLNNILVAMPPLNEQHKIVKKLHEVTSKLIDLRLKLNEFNSIEVKVINTL